MLLPKFFIGCAAASCVLATRVGAQGSGGPLPHVIVIKLVERPGEKIRFGFDPATFTAERGDTLEFVQAANTMHNVHFEKLPPGANLGRAAISRYLSTKGQTYDIVVDSRFAAGTYEIVCDPHSMMGMHAFLTVPVATGATTRNRESATANHE